MWKNIRGHKEQIAQLTRAVSSEAIAQTYLFTGPSGVGKNLVAINFAKLLLCDSVGDGAPCNKCRHCLRVANGTHPDVLNIEPDPEKTVPEISITQIREMQTRLQFQALEGRRKITIINDADRMHLSAANAALKILEEPPQATHFILISSAPHRLLPTIRSRCQQITFSPLANNEIIEHLEEQEIDPAEARQRALLSEGSLGNALTYPTEVLAETMTDLHSMLQSKKSSTILDVAQRWAADSNALPWRIQLLAIVWKDALQRSLAVDTKPSLPATDALIALLLKRPAPRIARELTELLGTVHNAGQTTFNKQLACEALLFRLTRSTPQASAA